MRLLDKGDWLLIESQDKQSVYAGIYENCGARAYETYRRSDLPNDLIGSEDLECLLINWSDWQARVSHIIRQAATD